MISESVRDAFKLEPEVKREGSTTLLRVQGLDSASLAEWIKSNFDELKVEYKPHLSYQFSDDEWIKIKNVDVIIST